MTQHGVAEEIRQERQEIEEYINPEKTLQEHIGSLIREQGLLFGPLNRGLSPQPWGRVYVDGSSCGSDVDWDTIGVAACNAMYTYRRCIALIHLRPKDASGVVIEVFGSKNLVDIFRITDEMKERFNLVVSVRFIAEFCRVKISINEDHCM